jgi:hypothetical protein
MGSGHAAIVISVANRTLPDCNGSIVEHVIRANPQYHFHVYLGLTTESTNEAEHKLAGDAVWSSFPCVVGAALETNAAVSASVRAEVPGVDQLPRGRGTARGKAMNVCNSCWRHPTPRQTDTDRHTHTSLPLPLRSAKTNASTRTRTQQT